MEIRLSSVSYLYNRNPYMGRTCLYIETAPRWHQLPAWHQVVMAPGHVLLNQHRFGMIAGPWLINCGLQSSDFIRFPFRNLWQNFPYLWPIFREILTMILTFSLEQNHNPWTYSTLKTSDALRLRKSKLPLDLSLQSGHWVFTDFKFVWKV